MKLVPLDTPLDLPCVCVVCKRSPDRELGEQVVDTEYQTPQGQELAGRKYLCERCTVGAFNEMFEPEPVVKEKK